MPILILGMVIIFQSTPSVGRATLLILLYLFVLIFQSTPSVGRATRTRKNQSTTRIISIHALRGEGDIESLLNAIFSVFISIHALRGEGDSKNIQICNIVFVHSAYKIIYFCDSCAFYLT